MLWNGGLVWSRVIVPSDLVRSFSAHYSYCVIHLVIIIMHVWFSPQTGKATHTCLAGLAAKNFGGTTFSAPLHLTPRWLLQRIPPLDILELNSLDTALTDDVVLHVQGLAEDRFVINRNEHFFCEWQNWFSADIVGMELSKMQPCDVV